MWVPALLIVLGVYFPVLMKMGSLWWNDSYAAHGMFVPLFSMFLLWESREKLRAVIGPGTTLGWVLILLGGGATLPWQACR